VAALAEVLRGVEPRTLRPIESGWDSVAVEVDGNGFCAPRGATRSLVARRALLYHALGPWHEAHYGLFLGNTRWVSSALAGVRQRLPKVTGTPDTMAR
jgi:hypothetical protein